VVDEAPLDSRNTIFAWSSIGDGGQVSEVQLEITPSDQIIRIVLMDADGAETEFRFAGWKREFGDQ